jgi:hypothetical protein
MEAQVRCSGSREQRHDLRTVRRLGDEGHGDLGERARREVNGGTHEFDGKDMPVTGSRGTTHTSVRSITDRINEIVNKRDGKVTQLLTNVLSPDGNTIAVIYMRDDGTGKTTAVSFATYERIRKQGRTVAGAAPHRSEADRAGSGDASRFVGQRPFPASVNDPVSVISTGDPTLTTTSRLAVWAATAAPPTAPTAPPMTVALVSRPIT